MAVSYSRAIEEIKEKANIVDVVGSVVQLKRAGANYKGLCPFHNDKNPSLIVSERKQIFTCFVCQASGDVIEFVKRYYGLTFPEAVEKLAAEYGIEIERSYKDNDKKLDVYYQANKLAARYFYESFQKQGNAGALYMQKRQAKPEYLKAFGVGYADGEWQSLTDYLLQNGIPKDTLIELGLVSKSDKSSKIYDKFRDRVIFPIINTRGKVIGFGGRIIGEGEPKYLNSQESPVFYKRYNLFGLNLSKNEIQKEGYAILVEGYMDVFSLFQAGVKNVCASLGTALTEEQAKLLSRYTNKVILCYDADKAGIMNAVRGIDILRSAGLNVKVLHVTDGKDPDEYIKKHGRDAFIKMATEASMADVDYKVALIARKYDVTKTETAITFFKKVAEVLSNLSPVEADLYIQKIASQYKISEGALRRETDAKQGTKPKATPKAKPDSQKEGKTENPEAKQETISKADLILEKTLVRLSFINSDYFKTLLEYQDALKTDEASNLFSLLNKMYEPGKEFDIEKIKAELDPPEASYLSSLLKDYQLGGKDKEIHQDCIKRLKQKALTAQRKNLLNLLEVTDDEADIAQLMSQINSIQKELQTK